jgi:Na+/melibiose symporter-like transporter
MRTEQWVTTRMFTAVIASALVLPALVPFFEAFRLGSMGLFLTGLFFLLGFGVSYYILLRWFLEMDTAARPSVTRQFSIVDLEEHQVSAIERDREGLRKQIDGR